MLKHILEPNKGRTVVELVAELDPSDDTLSVPIQIRSLAILTVSDLETLVYIGTESGALILFSLNPSFTNDSVTSVPSSRSLIVVTDRPLISIHALPYHQKVLLLSEDGFLFLIDYFLLQPVQRLSFPKRVTSVAPRVCTGGSDSALFGTESAIVPNGRQRLLRKLSGVGPKPSDSEFVRSSSNTIQDSNSSSVAVAVGKRMILVQLVLPSSTTGADAAKGVFAVLKEIQCAHPVKAMAWINDSIVVGTAVDGYTIYSCVTGQSSSLFSLPDPLSTPYLKSLCKSGEILLLVDNVGIIVSALGEPLGGSMVFRSVPNAIAEVSSYLITVIDGRMDLYHKKTGLCVQSVSFGGKGFGPSVVVNENTRDGEIVIVASPSKSKVMCFRKVSAEDQIKDLLRKKRFKEAIALVEELEVEGEMTKEMLSFVHAQVGFLLLFDLHFKEAVDHFLQSEMMQPSEIFPFIMSDPNRWSTQVMCFRKVSAEDQIKDLLRKKRFKEAIALVEELEVEGEMTKEMLSFVHAQVGFLLLFDLHFKEAVDHFLQSEMMQPSEIFPFIMSDPNRWSTQVPRNRYWGLHPPPLPLENVVDDGLMAIQRTIYLRKAGVETTADEQFLSNPPSRAELLESAIDSMIRYLQLSREKDLSLLVREGVDTLLVYLYRALNHVEEMELLASSENYCVVEELETLLEESGHLRTLAFLYASKKMSSKALAIWRILAKSYSASTWESPPVDDATRSTASNMLSHQKTAAVEASKLLEVSSDQDMVLQHFGWVSDVDSTLAVQVLTSDKRDVMLSPEAVIAAIDSKKVYIFQRYLQWLIEDQESDDVQLHTLYALSLAKSALEYADDGISFPRISDEGNVFEAEEFNYFSSSVRERLQLFLLSSDLYDPEEVLDLIEGSEFWLEKAILYRKLGQESLVLRILALKLEDSEAAEQYCVEIGRQDAYKQLLDMYLDPQDGKEPMFEAAIRLLHNHGESLNPQQILESLSPDVPLHVASNMILKMLRARVHHHCQGQVVNNVSRAINIDAKLARLGERSRHVQINDESVCDSCHARLGTKLFAMYPDDAIVCYKCFRRQGESVSVTGRDFKKDVMFKPGWLINP